MSNEVIVTQRLTLSTALLNIKQYLPDYPIDLDTIKVSAENVYLTITPEQLDLTPLDHVGWAYFSNIGIYPLTVGTESGGTYYPVIQLYTGEFSILRLDADNLYAAATAGISKLAYFILNEDYELAYSSSSSTSSSSSIDSSSSSSSSSTSGSSSSSSSESSSYLDDYYCLIVDGTVNPLLGGTYARTGNYWNNYPTYFNGSYYLYFRIASGNTRTWVIHTSVGTALPTLKVSGGNTTNPVGDWRTSLISTVIGNMSEGECSSSSSSYNDAKAIGQARVGISFYVG